MAHKVPHLLPQKSKWVQIISARIAKNLLSNLGSNKSTAIC